MATAPKPPVVKFQLMSDLHMHTNGSAPDGGYEYKVVPKAPYLLLPGDTGAIGWGNTNFVDHPAKYREWLITQCEQFEKVIICAGNHEFRGKTIQQTEKIIEGWEEDRALKDKLMVINNDMKHLYDINGKVLLTIVGCVLWTNILNSQRGYRNQDFSSPGGIKGDSVDAHNTRFKKSLESIKNTVGFVRDTYPERKILMMTHHSPMLRGCSKPGYDGKGPSWSHYQSDIVGGEGFPRLRKGDVWVFGHTHWNVDTVQDEVRLIANQRGGLNEYRPPNNRFNPEFTFVM